MPPLSLPQRIAVVLGGGGLKGFAHIGVLRALKERGIRPALYAGTSIGALIAAARVKGVSLDEMEARARALRKQDLFRINHLGMLFERMKSPSLYLESPLRELCALNAPDTSFRDLPVPLLVNTVDVERGTRVVWGLPGLQDVPVADAVYASCALPGFFPPGVLGGRTCIDGGTIDNLPAAIAALGMDAVIAVDVGTTSLGRARLIRRQGFAAIYGRAASIMMHALQLEELAAWSGPPMALVRPNIGHRDWFSFVHTEELITAGYAAASATLDQLGDALVAGGGIYPRRRVNVIIDREKCTGCGLCVSLQPDRIFLDEERKAVVPNPLMQWSPADGDFVQHCPVEAISVHTLDGARRTTRPITEPVLHDFADD
ncbi:MAG TPA: patatin-like phospholipase family protein [Gemmatimonadaceae bacterium]|nr:patatin-like phospholipase family protein [Gemmatimonadaceae bacterium]